MMDSDLQKLLMACLSGELTQDQTKPLIDRLKRDPAFREAFVAEIVLLGQLRAVQSSEPRWLQLEDELETKLNRELTTDDFENQVMQAIATNPTSSVRPSTDSINDKLSNEQKTIVGSPAWHRLPACEFNPTGWKPMPNTSRPMLTWLTVSVAAALVGIMLWSPFESKPDNRSTLNGDTTSGSDSDLSPVPNGNASQNLRGVAVLSQAIGVEWLGEIRPMVGQTLQVGDLKFHKGTVQIEFMSGVRLLVRGPADMELRATDEMMLRNGAASCFVTEHGRGFRMVTKEMEVIDLGTAFSIDVEKGKQSEVHVLEGAVQIKSQASPSLQLEENQAIRMTPTGPRNIDFAPSRFPQPSDLKNAQRDLENERFVFWTEFSKQLSLDPAVMLHYSFEEFGPNPPELHNSATAPSRVSNGAIIGCSWTEGRWPSKKALLYRNEGDRVLFQVPGYFPKLSFLAWVRIDALTQTQTSILMTEEPYRRKNLNPLSKLAMEDVYSRRNASQVKSVRWELFEPSPRISFSIAYADREANWQYESCHSNSTLAKQSNWGRWTCIAVTIDTQRGDVIQYHEGVEIGRYKLQHADPLLLDYMTLGNFSISQSELQKSSGLAQRRFYGAVDELLISQRIYSSEEIQEIWIKGKP